MNLFLIDIDGVLVESDATALHCYSQAIEDVIGIQIHTDWPQYQNVTDAGILDEVIQLHHVTANRSLIHRQVESRYLALLREHVAANSSAFTQAQGATSFVEQMQARADTHVAIATGNWATVAALKLRAAGVALDRMSLTTASDASSRTEIMALAAFRAKQDSGATFARRVFFGHHSWNKHAAQELGYDFVEVGQAKQHRHHIPNMVHFKAAFSQLALQ
ncbi:HAD family hydrolase [Photobacterium atrarenae]|uniref:Haloacid dehalogenase-like hydrolase n=1 Tax=Photobacterium atrarenae TaxID=865757 RepID=A0ABY5GBK2_9GAMM|nr:haloacid dehalogenase-like hydrolase [Photobacterium atrarenae]UTV26550.1 haloacid dehalogenase-like hydrolase [Photobacterium atrarenae]